MSKSKKSKKSNDSLAKAAWNGGETITKKVAEGGAFAGDFAFGVMAGLFGGSTKKGKKEGKN